MSAVTTARAFDDAWYIAAAGCHDAVVRDYHRRMATEPVRDPYEAEAEAVLPANPGLREELEEMVRQFDAGELETVDSTEVDAVLVRALGRPIKFR